jgi:hypothetical protein
MCQLLIQIIGIIVLVSDRSYFSSYPNSATPNFSFLFEKVDQAIAKGDNNQLTLALHSITEIAKSSPFKDFADLKSVTVALDDPDHEWVI